MSSASPDTLPERQVNNSPRLHKRRRTDSNTSSVVENHSKPATRRKTACQTCRLRKVKCDGVRPTCGLCTTTDSSCEYIDPLPQKLTLDSATQLLCGKLDQLQRTLDLAQTTSSIPHRRPQRNGYRHEAEEFSTDMLPDDGLRRHDSTGSTTVHEPIPSPGDERMKDFLKIPSHRTTADAVLAWDVFDGRWPRMALIGVHFRTTEQGGLLTFADKLDSAAVSTDLLLPNEEQIPSLVDKFLENVHTKNPVLDVEQLVKHSRRIAAQGLKWDGWTCLVLLASALGIIAKPFSSWMTFPASPLHGREPSWTPEIPATAEELQRAESYFVLACRRIGCLRYSILGAQCQFFAGVYLMYTLRPLQSWQYFIAASNLYQVHMKTTHGLAADLTGCDHLPLPPDDSPHRKTQRRLEESMYWSCFKSESEFRVELPLPQSELSNYTHPSLFPSPPSPAAGEVEEAGLSRIYSNGSTADNALGRVRSRAEEADDLRMHARLLCNEEESWYYYLTEIALRRIGNRIINAFFGDKSISWNNVQELLPIAVEYDTQVTAWSANLPLAMQHWEMSEAIRAPAYNPSFDGTSNPVSRELSWAIDNRLLEMRSWLYQPFLHHLIHMVPGTYLRQTAGANGTDSSPEYAPTQDRFVATVLQTDPSCTEENATLLHHFIASGIECNLKILEVRSLRHRHHGLWFDLRSTMCASLMLLAVVKSGHSDWIPGGAELLWGRDSTTGEIGGKIGHILDEFDFWTTESPDMKRHREVLEDVARFVRAELD